MRLNTKCINAKKTDYLVLRFSYMSNRKKEIGTRFLNWATISTKVLTKISTVMSVYCSG